MVELQLHQRCLSPEGNVRAKATDNAEHPNSSLFWRKATDTTRRSPIVNTDLTGKATTKTPVDVSSDRTLVLSY